MIVNSAFWEVAISSGAIKMCAWSHEREAALSYFSSLKEYCGLPYRHGGTVLPNAGRPSACSTLKQIRYGTLWQRRLNVWI